MEKMNIPKQCVGCPRIEHIEQFIEDNELQREFALNAGQVAMTVTEEGVAEMIGATFEDMPAPSDEAVQAITQLVRNSPVEMFEELDEELEAALDLIDELTEGCKGNVKMRATKNDTEYTVSLCGSPTIPEGEECDEAHVERRRKPGRDL